MIGCFFKIRIGKQREKEIFYVDFRKHHLENSRW